MSVHVAFLRGINVGGNKSVKMDRLKALFLELGFVNVRTVLASGNVVFEGENPDAVRIEAAIAETFGFSVPVTVWAMREVKTLVDSDPFGHIEVTPETRFYVTFMEDRAVCSLLTDQKTPDLMKELDKTYGTRVTTRNWATVNRVLNT